MTDKLKNFITKSTIKHGTAYDYSKVVFVSVHKKVIISCRVHGDFYQTPINHTRGAGCPECAAGKRAKTNIERFGVAHPMKADIVKERFRKTCTEKYGVEHPLQSPIVIQQIAERCQAQYGVNHLNAAAHILEQRKLTCIEKYGVASPRQTAEVRDKQKQTMIDRYGEDAAMKVSTFAEKQKQTMIDRYGVSSALRHPVLRRHHADTTTLRYGVDNYMQHHYTEDARERLKDRDWLCDQYQNKQYTASHISTVLGVSGPTVRRALDYHNIPVKYTKGFSIKCVLWLTSVSTNIQHALNGGEYTIPGSRYKVDGYCKNTNTVYEFHGDCFHGNPLVYEPHVLCNPFSDKTAKELYAATLEREEHIKALGYNLVVMWETDWDLLQKE